MDQHQNQPKQSGNRSLISSSNRIAPRANIETHFQQQQQSFPIDEDRGGKHNTLVEPRTAHSSPMKDTEHETIVSSIFSAIISKTMIVS